MSGLAPVVEYLVLAPEAHLVACQCTSCPARFVVPRAACPACGRREFTSVSLPTDGTVRTYSVVRRAPYDARVPAPYIPAVVALSDGTSVSACLLDVAPEDVQMGMAVELTTVEVDDGTSFGFRPVRA